MAHDEEVRRYLWAFPNTLVGLVVLPFVPLTRGHAQIVGGVLELHGGIVSWLLRHVVPLRGGALAMTFGHVVWARDQASLAETRLHERAHVRQCERWGPAFIPAYLVASLWGALSRRGAYAGNYFECQAVRQSLFADHDREAPRVRRMAP
jgi:hypothetical protein